MRDVKPPPHENPQSVDSIFECDLNGNGSYETDTGTTPTASHTYTENGVYDYTKDDIAPGVDFTVAVIGAGMSGLAAAHRMAVMHGFHEGIFNHLTLAVSDLHRSVAFYRDVLAARVGGEEGITNLDLLDEIRDWSASDISDPSSK